MCDQLDIAPKQLHHTGDNRYADVRAAQRQGVDATYFTQGDPNRYERGFRAELVGDDWMRSHLIGLSRATRLGHDSGDDYSQRHAALASNVLAPLLTGYLVWVLTTAQQMGCERLYFKNAELLTMAQAICQQWSAPSEASQVLEALPTCQALADEGAVDVQATRFSLFDSMEPSHIVSDHVGALPSSVSAPSSVSYRTHLTSSSA